MGTTPLDLPATLEGRFSTVVQGSGLALTQGVIYVPPKGQVPYMLSEPPGVTPVLILRGLNAPGVNAISCGHAYRGVTFSLAAAGGAFGAIRSQIYYRQRLDEVGDYAASRAENYKDARNAWLIYTGAVWGLSAVDYWIRPRMRLSAATPLSMTLEVPNVTRTGAVWRSLLVPGAGQEYAGHRTRGVVWLAGLLASGAGWVIADYYVNYSATQLNGTIAQAETAGPSEIANAELQVQQAQRKLDSWQDTRYGWGLAMAGFEALSLIDAMVMHLSPLQPTQSAKFSAIVPITPDGPAVGVSMRF
jgi:hypothetical protein